MQPGMRWTLTPSAHVCLALIMKRTNNEAHTAQVMSTPHALNGQELAIDRATPKEKGPAGQAQLAARMSASQQSSGYSGGSR